MNRTSKRTQAERRAESEKRIFHAAVQLFATQGYTRTSLSQIGKKAGYSGGLISNRYGSKENLLRLVLGWMSQGFLEDTSSEFIEEGDVRGSIHRFIGAYFGYAADEAGPIRALFSIMGESLGGLPELQDDINGFNERTRAFLEEIIRAGIDSGEVPDSIEPLESSMVILALLRGMTLLYLSDPSTYTTSKSVDLASRAIDACIWGGGGR